MIAVYGLYPDPDSAERALDSLRRARAELGFAPRDIAIISSEPFEGYRFGRGVDERDHQTIMPWLAALGGTLGGFIGFEFASFTQNAYPLATGGMPLAPLWTNGIITYELTMLGAILTTLVTLAVSARLPNPRTKLYDPEVSDGNILVGVIDPPDRSRPALTKLLLDAGTARVREFPPRF
jgi:hypothetical protein